MSPYLISIVGKGGANHIRLKLRIEERSLYFLEEELANSAREFGRNGLRL